MLAGLLCTAVTLRAADVTTPGWWNAFSNAALNEAVATGLAEHPESTAALAAVRASRADRAAAAAGRQPKADVLLGARIGQERTMYTDRETGDTDPFFGSAELSWELDITGRLKANVKSTESRTLAFEADVAAVRLMLASEIVHSFVRVAALAEDLSIVHAISTHEARLLDRTQHRHAAGLQSGPEVEVAGARLNAANHAAMLAVIAIDKERERLIALLGPNQSTNTAADLNAFTLPPMPPPGDPTNAVTRPDVQRAWWDLQSAESAASARQRDRYPTVALMASAAGEVSDTGEAEPWRAWVGPVVKLPLWTPGLKAASERSAAKAQRAAAHFQAVSLTAMREIGQAVTDRVFADSMVAHMQDRHMELTRVSGSMQRRRAAGLIQDSDWLEAKISALNAERGAAEWRKQALLSHLNLMRAWGGNSGAPH